MLTRIFFKQDCIPVGCVTSAAVAVSCGCLPGGVSAQGGVCPGGVSAQGGVCLGCVSAQGCVSAWGGVCQTPLNRMTDRCKNITLPQLRADGNKLSSLGRSPLQGQNDEKYSYFNRHNSELKLNSMTENCTTVHQNSFLSCFTDISFILYFQTNADAYVI